jgi:hypothetical protein
VLLTEVVEPEVVELDGEPLPIRTRALPVNLNVTRSAARTTARLEPAFEVVFRLIIFREYRACFNRVVSSMLSGISSVLVATELLNPLVPTPAPGIVRTVFLGNESVSPFESLIYFFNESKKKNRKLVASGIRL